MALHARSRSSCCQRPPAGQSIVEFALVSLTLLLLFFGTLDLGRGVFQRTMVTNAAREGARYGAVNLPQARSGATAYREGIVSAAAQRSPTLGLTTANVTTVRCDSVADAVSYPCGDPRIQPGDKLTVCTSYQFAVSAGFLLPLPAIPMRECSTVTVQ